MLIKGDCLTEMKNIEDNTVDLLFCDLPWAATSCKWDCALDLPLFWKQVNRVCKINCPMFFCCNAKFGNTLINSNPKNFRYDLVLIKSSPVGFLNAKKMPMKKHELIYVFYRKLPLYDLSSHKHKFIKCTYKKDIGGLYGDGIKRVDGLAGQYDPPLPNSILEIKSEKGKHPTQKPIQLIEWILKYYSKVGDTVLDPTMGSGSSGVACINMKRKYIGIEKDPDIFKIAKSRVLC